METAEFAKRLAAYESPKVRFGVRSRFILWSVVVAFWVSAGILFGHSSFLSLSGFESGMALQTLILIAATLLSGYAALAASTPDRLNSSHLIFLLSSAALVLTFIGVIQIGPTNAGTSALQAGGLECTGSLLLNCLLPAGVLYWLCRGLGFHQSKGVAVSSLLAAGLIGAISLQFACLSREPSHHLFFHLFPILGLAGMGILAAKVVFSPDKLIGRMKGKIASRG